MTTPTTDLRDELIRLGPWHMEVDVTPELTTAAYLDAPATYPESFGEVSFYRPRDSFMWRLSRIFPDGLEGRRVLDCACNCGAYLFYAKEMGAGECFGFDVREHWIRQARFLAEHRTGPGSDIRFEVLDLYELPALELEPFDITFFHGIFYHLPTPMAGLQIAADMTREFMTVNTATRNGLPDGNLAVSEESRVALNSGVYGLNWFPTGPDVMSRLLDWAGFGETRCSQWRKIVPQQPPQLGHLEMFAARDTKTFRFYDTGLDRSELIERVRFFVSRATPEAANILVAGKEPELLELEGRRARPFPDDGLSSAGRTPVEQLESLRAEGAEYLLIPTASWIEEQRDLKHHLEQDHTLAWSENGVCLIFRLGPAPEQDR